MWRKEYLYAYYGCHLSGGDDSALFVYGVVRQPACPTATTPEAIPSRTPPSDPLDAARRAHGRCGRSVPAMGGGVADDEGGGDRFGRYLRTGARVVRIAARRAPPADEARDRHPARAAGRFACSDVDAARRLDDLLLVEVGPERVVAVQHSVRAVADHRRGAHICPRTSPSAIASQHRQGFLPGTGECTSRTAALATVMFARHRRLHAARAARA